MGLLLSYIGRSQHPLALRAETDCYTGKHRGGGGGGGS